MPKIFIAHGTDHGPRDDLADMLRTFGLKPVLFSKSPDHSRSVIEKFEQSAEECEFAIILLAPDDKQVLDRKGRVNSRARQNVIFEMGWFFGRLGRSKTLLIYNGAIELPSDIGGVLYKRYANSVLELEDDIAKALKAGGVRIERSVRK